MSEAQKTRRIEEAWTRCQEWFGETLEQSIHLLFPDVSTSLIRSALRSVQRNANRHFIGVAWANREAFDPGCTDVDTTVEQFEAGNISSVHVNYETIVGALTLEMLLSVFQKRTSGLPVRGYIDYRMFSPADATTQERFEAIARHAIELEELLGASEVYVGPDRHDEPAVADSSWVVV